MLSTQGTERSYCMCVITQEQSLQEPVEYGGELSSNSVPDPDATARRLSADKRQYLFDSIWYCLAALVDFDVFNASCAFS